MEYKSDLCINVLKNYKCYNILFGFPYQIVYKETFIKNKFCMKSKCV